MIKAIIFDIDGVLADSRQAVVCNVKILMREFGFAVPDSEIEGMSSAHSADSVLLALAPELEGDQGKLKLMLKRLSDLTAENLELVKPLPIAEKIPQLAKKYRLAAATNRKASATMVLQKLGIGRFFMAVLTSADAPHKPNPKMIGMCLERLGVAASQAVFVGDNEEDRMAGEAAGVRVVIVGSATSCEKFLSEFL